MTEPVSTSSAGSAVASIAVLSILPGIDAAMVIGAFAGAVVFVMTADDLNYIKRSAFFLVSFLVGCLAAPLAASLLSTVLPDKIVVSDAVGALISAAIAVRLLLALIRRADQAPDLIASLRGKK